MAERETYTRLLTDDELRAHLERKGIVVFTGLSREWQRIERQVERLGFGEAYVVTHRKGPRGGSSIRVAPVRE